MYVVLFCREYEFELKDDMGSRLQVFAYHTKTLQENYTTLKIGDNEKRLDGSLYDLSLDPIKISSKLNDRDLEFELSYGQKFDDLTL